MVLWPMTLSQGLGTRGHGLGSEDKDTALCPWGASRMRTRPRGYITGLSRQRQIVLVKLYTSNNRTHCYAKFVCIAYNVGLSWMQNSVATTVGLSGRFAPSLKFHPQNVSPSGCCTSVHLWCLFVYNVVFSVRPFFFVCNFVVGKTSRQQNVFRAKGLGCGWNILVAKRP